MLLESERRPININLTWFLGRTGGILTLWILVAKRA